MFVLKYQHNTALTNNNSTMYILSLDQGTTSSRAILFDKKGEILAIEQKEFTQIYPQSAWVEHNPDEIWNTQAAVAAEVLINTNLQSKDVAAIGITNQRETTLIWNRKTGRPIYNAIVWQDRRTSAFCDRLKENHIELIRNKTGLVIDAYFSATKIKWLLDHVEDARRQAENGELAFGTIDTWLVWKLTGGKVHVTDVSNASRTMLFNINTLQWDEELLQLFEIPATLLPEVKSSSEIYGYTDTSIFTKPIAIAGIAGDQQASLFGQMCVKEGMIKNTYGTGCFMMLNTGEKPILSKNNLLTTIAWKIGETVNYALEGSVFIGGAAIQWLRDGLKIISSAKESEQMALEVEDNGGVYFVPALTGLGAPHWNQYARGAILGITRATTASHIARAALESIAFQSNDVLNSMLFDASLSVSELRVDGGAVANDFLMQFQADLLNFPVVRPKILETTALGAAYLAGLAVKYWQNIEEISTQWSMDKKFEPTIDNDQRIAYLSNWKKAVERSLDWQEH